MPSQAPSTHEPQPPTWPDVADDAPILFLIDASSALERRRLLRWIDESRPTNRTPEHDAWADIPASRRRSTRTPSAELEAALATDADPLLVPLRIAWLPGMKDGERRVRLADILTFGDPRDPGPLRQRWIAMRFEDRMRVVLGKPATARALRDRWADACRTDAGATTGLAEFVSAQATLALEQSERRLRGNRYKVPRLVGEQLLSSPAFRGGLAQIAHETGRSEADVRREAGKILKEIAATHSPFVIDIAAHLIKLLYTQGYAESLEYDREQLAGIASLAQRNPVVFLPTHKSNLDHLVLQSMLHENGLPPNHTAGGINMNFFPVGPIVRRSGVFFIRRTFKDDALYKHVLGSYIDYLVEKRFSLEWYIEGGRSRSGKLLPPRFGLLAYVVDAYRRGKSDDVHLIPLSVAYDQIQDVGSYVNEQLGKAKEKEGFGWFLGVIRSLRKRYGKVHIRFGEPVSLRSALGPPDPGSHPDPDERDLELQKLAFEVSVRINRATPITPTSLLTMTLLGVGDRALTLEQIRGRLENSLKYVDARKLPTSSDFHQLSTEEGILCTLDELMENDVVSRYDGGPDAVYRIDPDQHLAAAYYRNTIVHYFVNEAIVELALLSVSEFECDDPVDAFWAETFRLRDLLKFEFFFAEKDVFRDELRAELVRVSANWEDELRSGDARRLVERMRPFMAHRALRPFVEAYQVVADRLLICDPDKPFNEPIFLPGCIGLGSQYVLQRHIQSASSVSKALFETALKVARNRGLLEGESSELAGRREAFAEEIHDVLRRVGAIEALAASRRAGLIE